MKVLQSVNDLVTRDLDKAKELGLIGGLIYEDQYEDALKRAVGASKNDLSASSKLNTISSSSYFKTIKSTTKRSSPFQKTKTKQTLG